MTKKKKRRRNDLQIKHKDVPICPHCGHHYTGARNYLSCAKCHKRWHTKQADTGMVPVVHCHHCNRDIYIRSKPKHLKVVRCQHCYSYIMLYRKGYEVWFVCNHCQKDRLFVHGAGFKPPSCSICRRYDKYAKLDTELYSTIKTAKTLLRKT